MRKLKASNVEFEVTIESEDIPVRGNALASGDKQVDKDCEDEILDRLANGDESAWCCLLVKATWEGYTGCDSLGACSFAVMSGNALRHELETHATDHDMYENALADLNRILADEIKRGKNLEKLLEES